MKARCYKEIFKCAEFNCIYVQKNEIVNYSMMDNGKYYVINNIVIPRQMFLAHFETEQEMDYSDFEYILCNYVFPSAIIFPNEYCGVHHLIIQNWNHMTVMITVNKEENQIRVSYPEKQIVFPGYKEAIKSLRGGI